jgi:hypothetical protein
MRMKWRRAFTSTAIGLSLLALLAACGSSSGVGPTGTATPNQAAATATTKPKPTGVPTLTLATCQGYMSLSEANSIILPPTPATTIVPTNGDTGGACNYEYGEHKLDLVIFFIAYSGPVPIPESYLQEEVNRLAGEPGVTIDSSTLVSGIGDEAAYLAVHASQDGLTGDLHIFYILDGGLLFDCFTESINGVGPQGTQAQLQQCAEQVLSRL